MNIFSVAMDELADTIQYVNLVKLKFDSSDIWMVVPVLYASEDALDVLLSGKTDWITARAGDKAVFKFRSHGYEYIISGLVTDIGRNAATTMTIRFTAAEKYLNQRKHTRFDTDLAAEMKLGGSTSGSARIKNISKGGAMLVSDIDAASSADIDLRITFESGCCFKAAARVIRKEPADAAGFTYGVQFTGISPDDSRVIDKEIAVYERKYLKSLDILREYNKKSAACYDDKVVVFSSDADESLGVKENLVRLGVLDFEVFSSFKYYADFFSEEKPKIVIIDTDSLSEDAAETIRNLHKYFPQIRILLLLPLEYSRRQENMHGLESGTVVLYKPLIYNEFEQEFIKLF